MYRSVMKTLKHLNSVHPAAFRAVWLDLLRWTATAMTLGCLCLVARGTSILPLIALALGFSLVMLSLRLFLSAAVLHAIHCTLRDS